jgi:DNA-binding PadR family transcriptional regulator
MLKLNPSTGYDLKKLLDKEGRFMRQRTPLSQIYNTLKRMAEKGWLTYEVEPVDGKPDRKVYSVTPQGFSVFLDWLTAPHKPGFRFQEREVLNKIFFSCFTDDQTILQHLRTELAYRKKQVSTFRPRNRTVAVSPTCGVDPERLQAIVELTHQYGADAVDQYIDWLETAIDFFEDQSKNA